MANLKPVVRTNQVKLDGKCNIKIRVSHDHKTGYLSTPWDIEPEYMTHSGYITNKYPGASKLNMNINLVLAKYNNILIAIARAIRAEMPFLRFNTLRIVSPSFLPRLLPKAAASMRSSSNSCAILSASSMPINNLINLPIPKKTYKNLDFYVLTP